MDSHTYINIFHLTNCLRMIFRQVVRLKFDRLLNKGKIKSSSFSPVLSLVSCAIYDVAKYLYMQIKISFFSISLENIHVLRQEWILFTSVSHIDFVFFRFLRSFRLVASLCGRISFDKRSCRYQLKFNRLRDKDRVGLSSYSYVPHNKYNQLRRINLHNWNTIVRQLNSISPMCISHWPTIKRFWESALQENLAPRGNYTLPVKISGLIGKVAWLLAVKQPAGPWLFYVEASAGYHDAYQ